MLIGRDIELRLITDLLAQGRGPALFGEAGVGKTTLARAAAERSERRLVETGGLATLSWMPYSGLRRLLGASTDAGDVAYVARKVEASVGDGVLFLDDVHWADTETRAALRLLRGRVATIVALRRADPAAADVLAELAELDFELVPVEPLPASAAAELVRRRNPGLGEAATESVVRRAGGNPLLLEELASTGEPTESLRLAVASRLRHLDSDARGAMALLALAGRPLPAGRLGTGADDLVDAGIALRRRRQVELRHALLGEALAESLSAEERREVHARLGAILRDPGEAARHHAEAGERELAFAKAMRAVERAPLPGERASHLALAAANASGTTAEELRVQAAEASAAAGMFERAVALLEGPTTDRPALLGRTALVRARAAMADRELADAAAHLELATGAASAVGGPLEAEVAITRVVLGMERGDDPNAVIATGELALALAREQCAHVAAALHALAVPYQSVDYRVYVTTLNEALAAARLEGDVTLECRIADTLCRPSIAGAREIALAMIERTRELALTSWERRFRCRLAGIDFHLGAFRAAYEAAEELLRVALEPWERYLVSYYGCQAAADLGFHARATELLDELDRLATSGHESRRQALWARAETALLAGRPREALQAADLVFSEFPETTSTFARVARSWARHELGLDQDVPSEVAMDVPFLTGGVVEVEAVHALATGAYDDADELFSTAASRWHGQHVRGELRCLWAGGEALRRAGRSREAVERLLVAEKCALAHEHAIFLARARRSLRLAGEHRSASRGTSDDGLTAREAEILDLVAKGMTNAVIGRRLGIGRTTVEQLVRSASARLGARTRAQAASRARRS